MKTINNKLSKKLLILSLFTLFSLVGSMLPIDTKQVSAEACDSRTITGIVYTNGNDTDARFVYGTDQGSVSAGNGTYTSPIHQIKDGQDGHISDFISGLSGSTQYFYALQIKNSNSSQNWRTLGVENFPTPACSNPNPPANCPGNIQSNLSGHITSTGTSSASGTVTNTSGCTYNINIATYKMYSLPPAGDWISSQKLISSSSVTIGPAGSSTATINLITSASTPSSCKYQVDLFQGDTVPQSNPDFGGSQAAGHWLLDAGYGSGPLCNDTVVTPPGPTSGVGGYLDSADCSAITGWAFGVNFATVSVQLTDGVNSVNTTANQNRPDVGAQYPNAGNFHGYNLPTPAVFKDFSPHTISAYVIDSITGSRIQLINSPKTIPACQTVVVQPPSDVCPNIQGVQNSVPAGMHIDGSGNCVNDFIPPSDVCPNIAGVQNSVPAGMHIDGSGNCVNDTTPTDVCPNIAGVQTSVPSGMHIDGSGNCVNNVPNDVCPNIEGAQSSVPGGMHIDGYGNCVNDTTNGGGGNTNNNNNTNNNTNNNNPIININWPFGQNTQTCQDRTAINYGAAATCAYQQYIPQVLNNRPTVTISADSTSVAYGGFTTVRWSSTNATSCYATGGSAGWAGTKSIGPASFYTGSLTSGKTYAITCSNAYGSDSDSVSVNVRGLTTTTTTARAPVSSYVVINSSIDRNQPIIPTLDNTRPHPGDEINYTVTYQNVGNASITNLALRLDLPYEVTYISSTPNIPNMVGNTLIFALGTLRANAQGTVTVRTRVREDIPLGTPLNFPAVLTYTDPSGQTQSVNANVSAQVWSAPIDQQQNVIVQPQQPEQIGANAFLAGFLPSNIFGWLLLLVLILILVLLGRYLLAGSAAPFSQKTVTTTSGEAPYSAAPFSKKTITTTTIEH